jgi:hypothetical protein
VALLGALLAWTLVRRRAATAAVTEPEQSAGHVPAPETIHA